MDPHATHITQALQFAPDDEDARARLLELVYEQLHEIARRRMAGERSDHTLQATALVHEAYMKLAQVQDITWQGRAHFFGAAAEAMRRILIDHARRRGASKRGGRASARPLSVVDLATAEDPAQALAIDEALTTLEGEDARAAQVAKLRFFAGLSVEETAEALEISQRTVMREWAFARARLFELLKEAES